MGSIYQESQADLLSITKSQSSSQVKSASSKLSRSSSIAEIVRFKLQDYQDINDQQFKLLPNQISISKISCDSQLTSYMHYHVTQVPIGPNFQANLPHAISAQKYLHKNSSRLNSLTLRKIHNPQQDNQFYEKNCARIQQILCYDCTYEEIILIKNSFMKKSQFQTFEGYLNNKDVLLYWEQYFIDKQRAIMKNRKKRKRIK